MSAEPHDPKDDFFLKWLTDRFDETNSGIAATRADVMRAGARIEADFAEKIKALGLRLDLKADASRTGIVEKIVFGACALLLIGALTAIMRTVYRVGASG